MPGPLRLAFLGCGFITRVHSRTLRRLSGDIIRSYASRDREKAEACRRQYGGVKSYGQYSAAIEDPAIDAVVVAVPPRFHLDLTLEALAAGKHVLVEKPLANTIAEAEAMTTAAAAARARGVQSMVGFNYRRVPALALARELIAEGRLGTVRHVRAAYLQDWLADDKAPMTWRLRKETAGSGALGDIASHAIDQVQHLTGQSVTEVTGTLRTFVAERPGPNGPEEVTVDDAAWATLGMTGNISASVEASRVATGQKNSLRIEVYGSLGSLTFDLENLNELNFLDATTPVREQGFRRILVNEPEHPYLDAWWPQGHIIGWEHTFTHQIRDFLVAIDTGTAPSPSFEEGLQVQRILAAVEKSANNKSTLTAVNDAAFATEGA